MHRLVPATLTGGAIMWVAALVAAPFAIASASGLLVAGASLLYDAASFICHQRPERSFHLAAFQMPVCARCFGLYASGAAAAAAAWIAARGMPASISTRTARRLLAAAAAPTAVSWVLENVSFWDPGNVVRAMAALPLGAAAGWIFVVALRAEAGRGAVRAEPMRYHA